MTANRLNFRVWDKEYNQMVYPDGNGYFQLENDTVITGNGELFNLVNQETVDTCILMQSTGLTDKNDKEIFEGDILRDGYDIIVVSWSNTWSKFVVSYIDGEEEYQNVDFEDLEHPIFNFKIIGNIFQNPELLKN